MQVRSKNPVAPLLVTVVPPDDLGEIHTRVSPTGNLRKRNNDATIGRERTNTKNENGVSAWSRRNSNDDISTNFRPISMLQKSTQSSWNCKQCETVNLTEFLRRNLVVFHLEVEQQVVT